MKLNMSIYDSIVKKIIIDEETGCWICHGTDNGCGYQLIYIEGTMQSAHRVMYCCIVGAIPDNKEVHHTCRKRACVYPAHLEAVTHQENVAHTQEYDTLR